MRTAVLWALVCLGASTASPPDQKEFSNLWVAEIHGGEEVARRIARSTGYSFEGLAHGFEDHYLLRREDHPQVSKRRSSQLTDRLTECREVKWAEQQAFVKRSIRGVIPDTKTDQKVSSERGESSSVSNSTLSDSSASFERGFPTTPAPDSLLHTYSGATKHFACLSNMTSAYKNMFTDPLWTKQWYAQDYRTRDMPVMDLNLVPVYKQGITGRDTLVAIVDDGLQPGHPDLEGNHLDYLSYDMILDKEGADPPATSGKPRAHGTKCAGVIAMVANNTMCGVGVAYHAKVLGVRVLGERATEYMEARGLNHLLGQVDIYSSSWGPSDDGMTMEKLGRMTTMAFEKGVTEGRGGKGAIYVFAGGNGKHEDDTCAADGLINNINTIAISSVSQRGKIVYYSERCPAIFATAYSGGNAGDEAIATTDLFATCTTKFSGTSASAPLATGIIALTLSANPNLTYRDVMHLITMTAEVAPLADNGDVWYKNGKGFWVSNDFGFGLLNAENIVHMAKTWKTVPKKNTCVSNVKLSKPQSITVGQTAVVKFRSRACQGSDDAVKFLEQLEVTSTVQYPYRGAISIAIRSPSGTKTTLMETRPLDEATQGLNDWAIKSLHTWGEDPQGIWELHVKANPITGVRTATGYLKDFRLTFHGTAEAPAHFAQLPRRYASFRLPNGKTSEFLLKILKFLLRILNLNTISEQFEQDYDSYESQDYTYKDIYNKADDDSFNRFD